MFCPKIAVFLHHFMFTSPFSGNNDVFLQDIAQVGEWQIGELVERKLVCLYHAVKHRRWGVAPHFWGATAHYWGCYSPFDRKRGGREVAVEVVVAVTSIILFA